jgi:magnesium-transporting ATPase (P-type)
LKTSKKRKALIKLLKLIWTFLQVFTVCFILLFGFCFWSRHSSSFRGIKVSDAIPYLIGVSFVIAIALTIDLLLIEGKKKKKAKKRT